MLTGDDIACWLLKTRMPFGSNPSCLDLTQLTPVLDHLPPVRW